jgi:DNA-binding transcriptional ArsR family regulator
MMTMNAALDAEVLTLLEEQVAFHREQEGVHEAQEAFHREQRARHAAGLERASRRLARARAAMAGRVVPEEPLPAARETALGVSRLVARVVEDWPSGSPFGATAVAAEIVRRFGFEITPRAVSVKLRRLRDRGAIRAVREGQSHVESLFERKS